MGRALLIGCLEAALCMAQVVEGPPELSARAVMIQTTVCQEDVDLALVHFDLTVDILNRGSAPIAIYRMENAKSADPALSDSLESMQRGDFLLEQLDYNYPDPKDFVERMDRKSFVTVAPGKSYRLAASVAIFVPLDPRTGGLRSGSYWLTAAIPLWPHTTIRPEALSDVQETIWTNDVQLEPAMVSIEIPSSLEKCAE